MDFDTKVKLKIYEMVSRDTDMPDAAKVAGEVGAQVKEVESAFESLSGKRLLLLEEDDPTHIRMAPPFSGVETSFLVTVEEKSYFANCVWDAFGVAAALHQDALISTSDVYSKEPIQLEVVNGAPIQQKLMAHFAVPAAHWWDDIIYT